MADGREMQWKWRIEAIRDRSPCGCHLTELSR